MSCKLPRPGKEAGILHVKIALSDLKASNTSDNARKHEAADLLLMKFAG